MNSSRPRLPPQNPFQQHDQSQAAHKRQQQQSTSLALQQYLQSIRQACCVIWLGVILVILLSWAVPAPPVIGDLAAPEQLSTRIQKQQRGAGGVRGQAAALQNLSGAAISKGEGDKTPPLSKHWEADALEGASHGDGEEEESEEYSRDEVERRPILNKPHPRFVTSNLPHEIEQDSNRSAFGRRDDDESEEQESPDENEEDIGSAKRKQDVSVSSVGAGKTKKKLHELALSVKEAGVVSAEGGDNTAKESHVDPKSDQKKRLPGNDEKASRDRRSHDRLDAQANRTVKVTR